MANDYSFFDYIVDVFKGDMPGPLAMHEAPEDNGPLGEFLVQHVLKNALAAYLVLPESVFHSYIVFSQRCELKRVPAAT